MHRRRAAKLDTSWSVSDHQQLPLPPLQLSFPYSCSIFCKNETENTSWGSKSSTICDLSQPHDGRLDASVPSSHSRVASASASDAMMTHRLWLPGRGRSRRRQPLSPQKRSGKGAGEEERKFIARAGGNNDTKCVGVAESPTATLPRGRFQASLLQPQRRSVPPLALDVC